MCRFTETNHNVTICESFFWTDSHYTNKKELHKIAMRISFASAVVTFSQSNWRSWGPMPAQQEWGDTKNTALSMHS